MEGVGDELDQADPRRSMMGLAAAAFHWTPQTYWASTRHEYFAAYESWRLMNTPSEGGAK